MAAWASGWEAQSSCSAALTGSIGHWRATAENSDSCRLRPAIRFNLTGWWWEFGVQKHKFWWTCPLKAPYLRPEPVGACVSSPAPWKQMEFHWWISTEHADYMRSQSRQLPNLLRLLFFPAHPHRRRVRLSLALWILRKNSPSVSCCHLHRREDTYWPLEIFISDRRKSKNMYFCIF